jgi:hypothetical protein
VSWKLLNTIVMAREGLNIHVTLHKSHPTFPNHSCRDGSQSSFFLVNLAHHRCHRQAEQIGWRPAIQHVSRSSDIVQRTYLSEFENTVEKVIKRCPSSSDPG